MTKIEINLPKTVSRIADTLLKNNYEAYVVGGCVRDALLGKKPCDWDFATNANPEEIQKIFEHTVYENDYGTVAVVFDDEKDETLKLVEITPYRTESEYKDKRRPKDIEFHSSLDKDLDRRDFTINALAYDPKTKELVDNHEGLKDLNDGTVRTVGESKQKIL